MTPIADVRELVERLPQSFLIELQNELFGEIGERVVGKQTLFRMACELIDARTALEAKEADLSRVTAERDEARQRFNDIDLCRQWQAPCEWSLKLIAQRDAAEAEVLSLRSQLAGAVEALEPFAEVDGEGNEDMPVSSPAVIAVGRSIHYAITLKDFRRARTTLAAISKPEGGE